MLNIEKLTFAYNQEKIILDKFSCSIAKGELLVITGKSGSGKTTLCEILSRHYQPLSGEIYVNEKNSSKLDDTAYFALLHILKQNPHHNFIGLNPERDFLLWNSGEQIELFYKLLDKYSLYQKREELLWKLSFGEQKCLFFIYLELIKRQLWILDEPLEGVDDKRKEFFIESLSTHLQGGGSALISSHRVEQFRELTANIIDFEKINVKKDGI